MVLDYYKYDYEFAEPPRVTSLQNTVPLATFQDFGDDLFFVADQRGFEAVVYFLAGQYLKADKSGNIVDPRLQLNKVPSSRYLPTLSFSRQKWNEKAQVSYNEILWSCIAGGERNLLLW
jgi:hypothetical protein